MREYIRDLNRYPACIVIDCAEPTLIAGACYDHAVVCPNCSGPSTDEMDHYNGAEWECDYFDPADPYDHAFNAAEPELDLGQCPWYQRTGICTFGCQTEPACETSEPDEGWPTKKGALSVG